MDDYRTGYIDGEANRDLEVEGLKQQLANRDAQIAEWLDRNLYSAREYAEKLRNGDKP